MLRLRPTKARGQNFVADGNTIRRIVRLADVQPEDIVLEVGPGLGSLTLGLVAAAGRVTAVEIDPVLADALPATVRQRRPDVADRLQVLTADALRMPPLSPAPTVVVANLPYNVAVPVLLHLLAELPSLSRGLVMVQAEVADRLVAEPGSRVYGSPSVKVRWYADVRRAGAVSRQVFWPQPRVESGLVAFRRHSAPDVPAGWSSGLTGRARRVSRTEVFAVVDAAFAQRRKTLRAALADWAGSPEKAALALRAAGVDPGARGEQLDVAAFVGIAATRSSPAP